MREIQLSQGRVTKVDDTDYERLMHYHWHAAASKKGDVFYAMRSVRLGTIEHGIEKTTIRMHQQILLWFGGIDHIDGDGLNNQRSNLRIATRSTNMQNRAKFGSGRFKGVSRRGNRWVARIMRDRKAIELGRFVSEEEAAYAYDEAARQLYGKHAYINLTGA